MGKKISRRKFLKVGATAGATAALVAGCSSDLRPYRRSLEPPLRSPEEALPGEAVWYASTCGQCPSGCGIVVRVIEGRARKIEGNPEHPLNRGRLCARGQAGLQALYNPDRFPSPVRQSSRGSRDFQAVYWDDALDLLAGKLKEADPQSVAFLGGVMSDNLFDLASRFMKGTGAAPPVVFDLLSALEGRTTLAAASKALFGVPALPVFDVGQAEVVFSFGANFLETWLSPVYYGRSFGNMRRGRLRGRGYLVQFEPRMSMTAASADEWVPVKPGTEGLVAQAIGKIVAERRKAANVAGLYKDVVVGDVADASGVSAEQLGKLARIFDTVDHALAIPGGALAGRNNGLEATLAVQALNVVAGNLGQPGGLSLSPDVPSESLVTASVPASYADVQALIERMKAGQVQVLMVHGANPVFELPKASGFREALGQVPFVVSFAPFADETAVQADLVLPDHTYLESWGYRLVAAGGDRPVVSAQQPAVQPLYDTRSTAEVLLNLAQRLGGSAAKALPWKSVREHLQSAIGPLQALPGGNLHAASTDAFIEEWQSHGGWWTTQEKSGAPGASKEVLSSTLVVPNADFAGDAQKFPFHLLPYPSILLSDGRGANQPFLQEAPDPMTTVAWNNWVEINPKTAAKLKVTTGDIVKVTSPQGEIELSVYVYPGIRPDTVAIPVGQGHSDYGRFAQGRGSNVMDLLAPLTEKAGGALAWAATRVKITPTGRKATPMLARTESAEGVERGFRDAENPG
ncbi:MAG: molybdopterin-dependent oxidoreductase [Chloroflexi bacterium]|nr:molybdopterin-dependent oxidoreductase [Chloroflexota bacterium]